MFWVNNSLTSSHAKILGESILWDMQAQSNWLFLTKHSASIGLMKGEPHTVWVLTMWSSSKSWMSSTADRMLVSCKHITFWQVKWQSLYSTTLSVSYFPLLYDVKISNGISSVHLCFKGPETDCFVIGNWCLLTQSFALWFLFLLGKFKFHFCPAFHTILG